MWCVHGERGHLGHLCMGPNFMMPSVVIWPFSTIKYICGLITRNPPKKPSHAEPTSKSLINAYRNDTIFVISSHDSNQSDTLSLHVYDTFVFGVTRGPSFGEIM